MNRVLILLACLITLSPAGPASANEVDAVGDWTIHVHPSAQRPRECWMDQRIRGANMRTAGGRMRIQIAYFEGVEAPQVSLRTGARFDGATALAVGGHNIGLMQRGPRAWPKRSADDARLIEAMAHERLRDALVIVGDTAFPVGLTGTATALAKIGELCGR